MILFLVPGLGLGDRLLLRRGRAILIADKVQGKGAAGLGHGAEDVYKRQLLPYAEAVVGSRRLRTAVRRATWLSLAGSAAGVLLTAYLVSLGKFDLLTPLSLTVFLLLWTCLLYTSAWAGSAA